MGETAGDAMETEMSNGSGTGTGNGTTGKCLSSFVDKGTIDSHRYYLSRKTLLEMLRDRGYDISNSDIDLTLTQFRDLHGQDIDVDRLRISASHLTNFENKILAVFCGTGVVKVNSIRWIATQIMNKETLNRLIIVVQGHITSQAMKAVDLFPFKVEIFQITDLLVNITKHVLKPKHRVLTDVEKEKLLNKFNVDEKQLPRMSQKDAIAQYYGLEKGQVIEVTYNGEITGLHVTYRCIWFIVHATRWYTSTRGGKIGVHMGRVGSVWLLVMLMIFGVCRDPFYEAEGLTRVVKDDGDIGARLSERVRTLKKLYRDA
ncbi:hypothetical protein QVD17_17729 [Tagetes erecta]|uniref:DNA-directed RNA polymerase n=1 Tax=Tagetes erecta TaxID=13708 RepID=A0AAD8KUG7_TARER|nr:hypothetical protein QVD17_17729 [Tagetes erecta]